MSLDTVLLRDEFSDDRAAGAVNGTLALPGPGGLRQVTDATEGISIQSGELLLSGAANQKLRYENGVFARTPGLMAIINYNVVGYYTYGIGFFSDSQTAEVGLNRTNASSHWTIRTTSIHLPLTLGYAVYVMIMRALGAVILVKTGGNYLLYYIHNVGATSSLSVGIGQNLSSLDRIDYIRVAGYWLPIPIISDGFSTNGTSDGLGHAETSGIGSGGGGVAWSGATWSVSGGKAINTPNFGSELITNGTFDTDITGWLNYSSTYTTFEWLSGTLHVIAGGSGGYMDSPIISASVAKWYRVYFNVALTSGQLPKFTLARSDSGVLAGSVGYIQSANGANALTVRVTSISGGVRFFEFVDAASNHTIDNVSIKEFSLSETLSLHTSSTPDVFIGVDLSVTAGTQAGLALNWDSSSSPANGVIAYHDGANCKLEKCVAGVWTTVVSAAATYSANARLVVSKIGTAYRLYYNNALVGSGTISDAGIVSNTMHGRFSTDAGNTLDNYTCYASGTSGEYDSALAIRVSASGVSAGVGDSTANATRKRTVSGASAGVGDSTANATRKRTVSGTSAGVGSANGTGTAKRLVSGQSSGTGSANGAISVRRNVSGQSDGVGSASATSLRKRAVSGTSAGRGTATIHNHTVSATISS